MAVQYRALFKRNVVSGLHPPCDSAVLNQVEGHFIQLRVANFKKVDGRRLRYRKPKPDGIADIAKIRTFFLESLPAVGGQGFTDRQLVVGGNAQVLDLRNIGILGPEGWGGQAG